MGVMIWNGYCSACCVGKIVHEHSDRFNPVDPTGWTWEPAVLVAIAVATREQRRWRVRSIPVYKGGDVIGWRYWAEPAGDLVAPRQAEPHPVIVLRAPGTEIIQAKSGDLL